MSGPLFEKIFGCELLFFGVGVGRVCFLYCFAYVFALLFGFSLPKMSRKILLMSGLVFLSAWVGRPPPLSSPPSFCPLSLSLSFFCLLHACALRETSGT